MAPRVMGSQTTRQPSRQRSMLVRLLGGGIVWFLLGRYKTTRSLLVRNRAIALVGTGYASVIAPEGSFDTVVIQSNVLGGNRVIDLYLDEAGKTGGCSCTRNASPSSPHDALRRRAATTGSRSVCTTRSCLPTVTQCSPL